MGEKQGLSLERRAQKLADNWWANKSLPPVTISTSGIRIVGCKLGFGLGTINVQTWQTRFILDVHDVHRLSPDAIALGYANEFQLFIAKIEDVPHLVARKGIQIVRWKSADNLIPEASSPLRVALDRAKALGYLDYLKGES